MRLAERYVKELGGKLTFEHTTDRAASLRDADFVINTAGKEYATATSAAPWCASTAILGAQLSRQLHDEPAPDAGRGARYRAHLPQRLADPVGQPRARGHRPRSTRQTGVKIIGLCHGHNGYRNIAKVLGLDPDKVTLGGPRSEPHHLADRVPL